MYVLVTLEWADGAGGEINVTNAAICTNIFSLKTSSKLYKWYCCYMISNNSILWDNILKRRLSIPNKFKIEIKIENWS